MFLTLVFIVLFYFSVWRGFNKKHAPSLTSQIKPRIEIVTPLRIDLEREKRTINWFDYLAQKEQEAERRQLVEAYLNNKNVLN